MSRSEPRPLDVAAGAVVSHWKENGRAVYPGDQLAKDLDQALDEYHRRRVNETAALSPIGRAAIEGLALIAKTRTPAEVEASAEVAAQRIADAAQDVRDSLAPDDDEGHDALDTLTHELHVDVNDPAQVDAAAALAIEATEALDDEHNK